jgi:hypothetical protein
LQETQSSCLQSQNKGVNACPTTGDNDGNSK